MQLNITIKTCRFLPDAVVWGLKLQDLNSSHPLGLYPVLGVRSQLWASCMQKVKFFILNKLGSASNGSLHHGLTLRLHEPIYPFMPR